MDDYPPEERRTDLVPRLVDLAPAPDHLLHTLHQTFVTELPGWASHAAQTHICDMAIDLLHSKFWLATWGGVLCWDSQAQRCIRHTSAQGLPGNATRCITVDHTGIIWAGGRKGGLCSLEPATGNLWQLYPDLQEWTVLALAPRRAGGIYIALQACPSRCALAEITAPGAELRLLRENGLPVKAVDTLYVTEKDTLWLGNAWGLHAYRNDEIHSFEYVDDTRSRIHVRAITQSLDGWLWIGTQRGLYRFKEDHEQQFLQNEDWPRDMIFNFAVEPSSGDLWCLTSREIGRLYDRTWQSAFQLPPGQTHRLVTVPREFKSIHPSSKLNLPHGQIWAGGAGGLYQVGLDNYEAAFSYTAEDGLSNAVQALWVDADNVWVGSARGLGRFDGETWKHYAQDALNLRDVRAIAPGHREGQLWIGSWWGGLQKIQQGVHIPGQILTQPVVALSTGLDGSMWAATIDEVYWLPPGSRRWQPLSQSVQEQLGGAIIQTICHQLAHAPGGGTESTLWVGTSNGLLYYRPEREAWGRERALDKLAIQALSVAPRTNRLWIGTSAGLYSELTWRCCYETNTMALAFGLGEEDFLWLGTPQGLEAWILPKDKVGLRDRPVCSFTAANSGLAANRVTALAIRTRNEQQELWIGSPNGISCYQIQQPEEKA